MATTSGAVSLEGSMCAMLLQHGQPGKHQSSYDGTPSQKPG